MASSNEGGGGKGGLKEDALVAALAPDASAPADATVLHGFVGKSTQDKCWRLYLDASLGSYVEVSEDDILYHRQVPDDGGTLLWVPKSLELKVTKVTSTTIQAEFLSGAIATGRMKPRAAQARSTAAAAVRTVGCPSILNNCLSRILPCPSDGCPSFDYCPTETSWCYPSEFRPLCTIIG